MAKKNRRSQATAAVVRIVALGSIRRCCSYSEKFDSWYAILHLSSNGCVSPLVHMVWSQAHHSRVIIGPNAGGAK